MHSATRICHIDVSQTPSIHDEILRVLRCAYGGAYFGDDVHRTRLLASGTTAVCARDADTGQVIAASYIDSVGKWGAVGVLPSRRRSGLATGLLLPVVGHDRQFIEASVGNSTVAGLAFRAGFRPLTNRHLILEALRGLELDATVATVGDSSYLRTSVRSGELMSLRLFQRNRGA